MQLPLSDLVAGTSASRATLIVCAGTNASTRSEVARRLQSDPRVTVLEVADAAALKTELSSYTPLAPICAAFFYFFPPGTTRWMGPDVWWRNVRANFAQWLPEIAETAHAHATINHFGGGFVKLELERVTLRELEEVWHFFDESLGSVEVQRVG